MTVLEVQRWETNSALIEAAFRMHVFTKPWAQERVKVLDPTYGKGIFWRWTSYGSKVLPGMTIADDIYPCDDPYIELVGHDIRQDAVDYRSLPYNYNSFDVVVLDPDYVAPGGRATSTIGEFNDRYGLKAQYESPASLQMSINQGIDEAARVVTVQGIVMVKCMNYISSGKLWLGEYETITAGLKQGLVVEDIFVHQGDPGPQPEHARQMHARSNSSRLIVFRKPGRRNTKRSTT
jgi:hypothetical protein